MSGSDSRTDNVVVNTRLAPSAPPASLPGSAGRQAVSRRLALALSLAGLLAWATPPGARASDLRDHERARAAVLSGEAMPLADLRARLQRTHPGQWLELELEREEGRWVYEVKLLQSNGQLMTLDVDARTGAVLQVTRKQDRQKDRAASSKEASK